MFEKFMQNFIKWFDKKFEKYRVSERPKLPEKPQKPEKPPVYTPKTLSDFIGVLKRTPQDVLSSEDRARIAAVMSFDDRRVADLMVLKEDMVFVKTTEVLGPLVLDKLYQSGFTNFPVVDSKGKVKGIIHTEALNALEIKTTDRASKYLDQDFNYLHMNDSLAHAAAEISRQNTNYFLVLDSTDALAGFFTTEILLNYLLGKQ